MATNKKGGKAAEKIAPAVEHEAPATAEAPKTEGAADKAAPVPRTRGPRGVEESAVITVRSAANPKREGSKAFQAFSHYVDGMTVGEYCDAMEKSGLGKEATPNLVYDAGHGFISIAGYSGNGEPKPVKEAKPKAEKKAKAEKTEGDKAAEAADAATVNDETAD